MTITEPEALLSLAPRNVEYYLSSRGWQPAEARPDVFTIWSRPDSAFRVLLPASQEFVDYPERMSELLNTLEEFEGRSQVAIAADIRRLLADTIRVRRDSEGQWEDDSIPLEAGAALVVSARNMLLAGACAAVAPRPVYPTRKPEKAEKYIGRVRMGHTERGSYVVTLISPMATNLSLFEPFAEEPFERRATRTMAEAIAAATRAALEGEKRDSIEPLKEVVGLGVSANLLDALAGLNEDTGAARVSVAISWASGSGLQVPVIQQVTIPHRTAPIFREASRVLKEESPIDQVQVQGFVTDLHRDLRLMRDTTGASGGSIVIAAQVEGILRKVRVELPFDEYERAAQAHTKSEPVRMVGNLRREGRSYVLYDPSDVVFFGDKP